MKHYLELDVEPEPVADVARDDTAVDVTTEVAPSDVEEAEVADDEVALEIEAGKPVLPLPKVKAMING